MTDQPEEHPGADAVRAWRDNAAREAQAAVQPVESEPGEDILQTLHDQVERLELRLVMSPADRHLANAILVLLNVLIDERKRKQLRGL